jgi:hypothetical protein
MHHHPYLFDIVLAEHRERIRQAELRARIQERRTAKAQALHPIDLSGSSARRRNIARALATLLRPTRSSSAFRDERRDPPSTGSEPHRTSDAIGDERIRFAGQRVDARPPVTAGRPSACTHASRRASR